MFHFSVSHGTLAAHAGFNVYAGCGVAGGKGYHSVCQPVVPALAMLLTTGSFRSISSARTFFKSPLYNVQKPFLDQQEVEINQ